MNMRAQNSGISLTQSDASVVKGMLFRGDRQHDIAAWFGVNGGRIAEIANGGNFGFAKAADQAELPPPGPYMSGQSAHAAMVALKQAEDAIKKAQSLIH